MPASQERGALIVLSDGPASYMDLQLDSRSSIEEAGELTVGVAVADGRSQRRPTLQIYAPPLFKLKSTRMDTFYTEAVVRTHECQSNADGEYSTQEHWQCKSPSEGQSN